MSTNQINTKKIAAAIMFLLLATFTACKKESEPEQIKPVAEHIEIGYANNKQGIRGRDFHFNADVVAGEKISTVMIKILPKMGETYEKEWEMILEWSEFKGLKNATVHKHFTIPSDAPEGVYAFFFIVNDENGTEFVLQEDFTILDAANMPVDPVVDRDILSRNDDMIYYMGTFVESPLLLKKNEKFTARAQVKQIAGNGVLYTALIKRKLDYYPETIANLDLEKAIIISKVDHVDLGPASKINTYKLVDGGLVGDDITIGADKDGIGNMISGEKKWESGQYDLVILYQNTTYNMSSYKSIPLTIEIN